MRRITVFGIAIVSILGVSVWAMWPAPVGTPAWIADYDVTASLPGSIAPGTVIDGSAPAGYSHLILKSLPRVRDEHRSKLNSLTVRMSAWMFTAIAADVKRSGQLGGQYQLRMVALGLGTSANGQDTILTPETAAECGVQLDWITRSILTKGYETQRLSRVVIHGPSFGLVDTPVWYRCGERNRSVRFRYALLVNGLSGRLDVLVWLLDPNGGCGDSDYVAILPPGTVDPVELIPDMKEFNPLGIPSDAAFGVDRLPRHQAHVLLLPEARSLAAQNVFTAKEASALEAHLRQLLDDQR